MQRIFLTIMIIIFSYNISLSDNTNDKILKILIYPSKLKDGLPGNSTNVISYEDIKKSSYNTMGSLISRVSSIHFDNLYYGNDSKSKLQIRGQGEQASRNVMILVNGKKINDFTIASPNLSRINIKEVLKIEIIKGGSASTIFGDGAVAGAINIITKNPIYIEDKVQINQSFGSFNKKKSEFNINKKIGNLFVDFFASNSEGKGYRENDDFDFNTFNISNSFITQNNDRFNLDYSELKEHQRLPGSILLSDFIEKPKYSRYPKSWADEEIKVLQLGYENKINKYKLELSLEEKDQFTSDNYGGNTAYKNDTKITTYKFSGQKKSNHYLNNNYISSTYAFDVYNSYYDVNAITSNYLNSAEQTIIEPYFIGEMNLSDKTNLSFGLRSHHYDLEVFNETTSKSNILSKQEDNYAWTIGADYNLNNENKFFTHISRAFRSPRLDEVITVGSSPTVNDINHQYSHDIELGYKLNSKDTKFQLAMFRSLIKDQIFYLSETYQNTNTDPSIHQGIELDYKTKISNVIDLKFSGAINESYFTKGDYKNNTTPYVPKYNTNSSIEYNFLENFDVSLSHKYVGSRFAGNDEENELDKADEYNIFDLNLSFIFNDLNAKASIINLLDEKYYSTMISSAYNDALYVYPLPGRSFWFELSYNF